MTDTIEEIIQKTSRTLVGKIYKNEVPVHPIPIDEKRAVEIVKDFVESHVNQAFIPLGYACEFENGVPQLVPLKKGGAVPSPDLVQSFRLGVVGGCASALETVVDKTLGQAGIDAGEISMPAPGGG